MKKLCIAVCIVLAASLLFTLSSCETKENGVTIKYATFTLSYTDTDGKAQSSDITVKLYTNYAPKTIARVIDLIGSGFYTGKTVNTIEASWISIGGYTEDNGKLVEASSGENLNGEFLANGWSGNKLTVSAGTVLMYRKHSDINGNNYNTANCRLVICTSSGAPFYSSEYCIIGKITDSDQLSALDKITELRSTTDKDGDGNDVTTYKRYYTGGLDTVASHFLNEAGTDVNEIGNDNYLEYENIAKILEGGELYRTAGVIDDEAYNDYIDVAGKIISAYKSVNHEFFYYLPYNGNVKITAAKVTNKI